MQRLTSRILCESCSVFFKRRKRSTFWYQGKIDANRGRSVSLRQNAILFQLSRVRRSEKQRSEEHTSELQSRLDLVCRLLLEKKKKKRQSLLAPASRLLGSPALVGVATVHFHSVPLLVTRVAQTCANSRVDHPPASLLSLVLH